MVALLSPAIWSPWARWRAEIHTTGGKIIDAARRWADAVSGM
jgi:hypothetical protein